MLASFGQGNVIVDLLIIFFWIIWFWLLITVFSDLFRDHELSGWGKTAWIIFVIVLPYLGVFVYFIARGRGMQERAIAQQKAANEQFKAYVQETAATGSPADELAKLGDLHDKGKLSDEEFAALKAKVLAS
jgi:hypothetical protein